MQIKQILEGQAYTQKQSVLDVSFLNEMSNPSYSDCLTLFNLFFSIMP